MRRARHHQESVRLEDGATVGVVGGGPSGAFFAIRLLQRARRLGRELNVRIIEKKRELRFYEPWCATRSREGCNYCAGGISPRMTDALEEMGVLLPAEILRGRAASLTVHSEWKNVELRIPEGRTMFSVFRGSRPRDRPGRHVNFDSVILQKAVEEGAEVTTGNVSSVRYSANGKPVLCYRTGRQGAGGTENVVVDLAVFATGVNEVPRGDWPDLPVVQTLRELLPGFQPPKVRKALICELALDEESLASMKGEVHFVAYGSRDLQIEMSSLIPKERCLTVVLLGRSVDKARPGDHLPLVDAFLNLPHIRRLLRGRTHPLPMCVCNPNMSVGAARRPLGHRVAVVGDMAVARLYKDGILSAYQTSDALASCALEFGLDQRSLRLGYWPAVRRIRDDNRFGRVVFLLSRATFNNPVLARVLYQAVSAERRTRPGPRRRLAGILWRIASGDDSYAHILASMLHPASVSPIAVGFFLTVRNYVTEQLFGLTWEGQERHATGMHKEDFEAKRQEINELAGAEQLATGSDFESMYSIRIKAGRGEIFDQLWRFGGEDMQYFRPRLIRVHRTKGTGRDTGTRIQYDLPFRRLRFSIVLEKVIPGTYLVYRVRDGFARNGILVFAVEGTKQGCFLLSIYVAFNFPRGKDLLDRCRCRLFRAAFPGFVHDVLWTHSLCKLKMLAESE